MLIKLTTELCIHVLGERTSESVLNSDLCLSFINMTLNSKPRLPRTPTFYQLHCKNIVIAA